MKIARKLDESHGEWGRRKRCWECLHFSDSFYVVSTKIKPGESLKYSRRSCFISLSFSTQHVFHIAKAYFSSWLFMAKWWLLIKTIELLFVPHFANKNCSLKIGTLSCAQDTESFVVLFVGWFCSWHTQKRMKIYL